MTIKALTDLRGLKEKNISELEKIGITSISELAKAINSEEGAKNVIKTLSGIGPKTVNEWKAMLVDSTTVDMASSENSKAKNDDISNKQYKVKPKPKLDDITKNMLIKRLSISKRRPQFRRQEWFRYSKLGDAWRKPKGIHSKMKRQLKRRSPIVKVGYRGPRISRELHPSGFSEVLVFNIDELDNINPIKQAIRVGRTVGIKKRIMIENKADELGIRILNRMAQSCQT